MKLIEIFFKCIEIVAIKIGIPLYVKIGMRFNMFKHPKYNTCRQNKRYKTHF